VGRARKTIGGVLLLQLKKQTNKASEVRTIAEDTTGAETHLKTSIIAVEIRGIDADASPDNLVVAISTRITTNMTAENIKPIKPGYEGKLTAVVLLPARAANELAAGSRLRSIGWASCSTRICIPMNRCTRCLDFGYRKNLCTGPDRSGTCLNLWRLGHTINDCDTEERCGLCEENDVEGSSNHFSGSGSCPTFKRFLANCRKKR